MEPIVGKLIHAGLADLRAPLVVLPPLKLNRFNGNPQEAGLKRTFLNFLSDQSGATAIEYGLIAAGIALAIIAVVNGLGTSLNDKFSSINSSLK
jgi:pilus assembly protein Flp/PilA